MKTAWLKKFTAPLCFAALLALCIFATENGGARAAAGFARPFLASWAALVDHVSRVMAIPDRSARQRIARLEAQVRALEEELLRRRHVERENQDLRGLFGLPAAAGWEFVPARVISRDPAAWKQRLRIGLGERDGVGVGAAVLCGGVVAGRVCQVTRTTALVMTVLDPACRLIVAGAQGAGAGVVNGSTVRPGPGRFRGTVRFFMDGAAIKPEELLETSALGAQLPAGLPVARVVRRLGPVGKPPADAVAEPEFEIELLAELAGVTCVAVACPRRAPAAPVETKAAPTEAENIGR